MDQVKLIKEISLFNTPTEVGLRSLLIINSIGKPISIDRLVIYDYLSLNTADLGGPSSLHPPIPHRSVQLFVRREIIQKGLKLLISRGLIKVEFNTAGILYQATELTMPFLKYFENEYKAKLEERVNWVLEKYGSLGEEELKIYVSKKIDKWGGELVSQTIN